MQFRAERDQLLTSLVTASRAATSRISQSVSSLQLTLKGDQLSVVGTDSDLTIEAAISVAGASNGVALLPPRLTTDIVRAFSPGAIEFAVKDDETVITSGRAEFTVRNVVGAEIRSITSEGDALSIPAAPFAEGLRQVGRAALMDDTRAPQLTGILLQQRDNGLRMVATDSYRLALRDIPAISSLGLDADVIVPARALSELQRLISDAETISFARGDTSAKFVVDGVTVTTRLLTGPFPDYERLVPPDYPVTFTCDRGDLIDALKRVRVVIAATKDGSTPVRLQFDDGALTLTAKTAEAGVATDTIDGKLLGESTLIALNPTYTVDGLEAITGDEVTVKVIDNSKPVTLSGNDDAYAYLLMPVRVS